MIIYLDEILSQMLFANSLAKEVHKLRVYQTPLQSISTICFCHPLMPFLSRNSNEENKKMRNKWERRKNSYKISNNHDYF